MMKVIIRAAVATLVFGARDPRSNLARTAPIGTTAPDRRKLSRRLVLIPPPYVRDGGVRQACRCERGWKNQNERARTTGRQERKSPGKKKTHTKVEIDVVLDDTNDTCPARPWSHQRHQVGARIEGPQTDR